MSGGNLPPWGFVPDDAGGNAGGPDRLVLPAVLIRRAVIALRAKGYDLLPGDLESAAVPIGETDIGKAFGRSIETRVDLLEELLNVYQAAAELEQEHDRRVAGLLEANNVEVERRRAAEREVASLRGQLLAALAWRPESARGVLDHLVGEHGRPLS